jgi:hypothetical protein
MGDDLILALANADSFYQTYSGDYRQSSAPIRLVKYNAANYQSKEGWDYDISDPAKPQLLTHLEPGDPPPPVDRSKPGLMAKSLKYKLKLDPGDLPAIAEGLEPPSAQLVGILSPSDAFEAAGVIPDVDVDEGTSTAIETSSLSCPVYTDTDNGHFILLEDAITTTAPLPEVGPDDSGHLVAGSYDPETNIEVNTACRLIARSLGVERRGECTDHSNKIPGESTDLVVAREPAPSKLLELQLHFSQLLSLCFWTLQKGNGSRRPLLLLVSALESDWIWPSLVQLELQSDWLLLCSLQSCQGYSIRKSPREAII